MTPLISPRMLYRKGTEIRLHGVHVDTMIVDEHEAEGYASEGWRRTPKEAQEAWEEAEALLRAEEQRKADAAQKSDKKGKTAATEPNLQEAQA